MIKYDIITFVCLVKVNINIWVRLSQLLCLVNLFSRSVLFNTRTVRFRASRDTAPYPAGLFLYVKGSLIVIRCPKDTLPQWLLQTFTAITSFILYVYSIVLLASITLVPALDVICAIVVVTASAGFDRLVLY